MHLIVKSHQDAKSLCKKKKRGPWMILYKARWCGHCKMLKPQWKEFMIRMKKVPQLNIAEVDSDYMSSMDEHVVGYPTIKMYHDNKPVADFQEERSVSELQNFAMNNMPRPSHNKPKPVVRKSKTVVRKPKSVVRKSKKVVRKPKPVVRKPKPVVRKPKPVVRKSKKVVRKPKPVVRKSKKVVRKPKSVVRKSKKVVRKTSKNLINRMKKRRMSTQLSNKNIVASLRKSLSNIHKQSMNDKRLLRNLVSRK
jgi:hypothetical protein